MQRSLLALTKALAGCASITTASILPCLSACMASFPLLNLSTLVPEPSDSISETYISPVVPNCTPTDLPARSSAENTVFSGMLLLPHAVSENAAVRVNMITAESIEIRFNTESFFLFIFLSFLCFLISDKI